MVQMPESSVRAKPLVLVDTKIISVSSFMLINGETSRLELESMLGAGEVGNNMESDDSLVRE